MRSLILTLSLMLLAACSSTGAIPRADVAGVDMDVFAAMQNVPTDPQVIDVDVPPLDNDEPVVLPLNFTFELNKSARVISYEDAWTNLKGEREKLPLTELAGTNPYIIWKHVMALRVIEVRPNASGSATPATRTSIVQSAEDLVSSYEAMSGPGITTKFDGGVAFRMNTFTFQADDVIDMEKLPHSFLKGLPLHIVYMREGSPFAPYVIIHGPIDEFRSLVAKLQGRKIITLGWDIKDAGQ